MNFEEFKEYIVNHIKEYLPDKYSDYSVKLIESAKDNLGLVTGLVITNEELDTGYPVIYLESEYSGMVFNGNSLEQIMKRIASTYEDFYESTVPQRCKDVSTMISDFSKVKDRIFPKLINTEMNSDVIRDKVHVDIEDLSTVFYIQLDDDGGDVSARVGITNKIMDGWDIDVYELFAVAKNNLENHGVVTSLEGYLLDAGMIENSSDGICDMLIITNDKAMDGAAQVLNHNLMSSLFDKTKDGFYLLPSSVHEMLLCPKSPYVSVDELRKIVKQVNTGFLDPKDVLSDGVYTFNPIQGLVKV